MLLSSCVPDISSFLVVTQLLSQWILRILLPLASFFWVFQGAALSVRVLISHFNYCSPASSHFPATVRVCHLSPSRHSRFLCTVQMCHPLCWYLIACPKESNSLGEHKSPGKELFINYHNFKGVYFPFSSRSLRYSFWNMSPRPSDRQWCARPFHSFLPPHLVFCLNLSPFWCSLSPVVVCAHLAVVVSRPDHLPHPHRTSICLMQRISWGFPRVPRERSWSEDVLERSGASQHGDTQFKLGSGFLARCFFYFFMLMNFVLWFTDIIGVVMTDCTTNQGQNKYAF